jgi:hypothetical protein
MGIKYNQAISIAPVVRDYGSARELCYMPIYILEDREVYGMGVILEDGALNNNSDPWLQLSPP